MKNRTKRARLAKLQAAAERVFGKHLPAAGRIEIEHGTAQCPPASSIRQYMADTNRMEVRRG